MKNNKFSGDHFRNFASSLEGLISGYETDEDHYTRQKRQVETLCALETQFRETLIRDSRGPSIYKAFVRFVRDERRNILSARPYFRERQDVFKTNISPALHARQDKTLYQFNINYPFIAFVMKQNKFGPNSKLSKIAKQVEAARKELIEMNLPLAISRARVFARYSQAHLEYMDLVQVATEGLIAAIDKFVLPYRSSFGAVMYGRITGDLVECNSETLIHFFPTYKRKLYTVNKFVKEGKTFQQIAEQINAEAKSKEAVTNEQELQQLYVAAYTVSGDSHGASSDPDQAGMDENPIHRFEADESWQPDVRVEKAQLMSALQREIKKLSLFEQKLLAIKGIQI